MARFDAIWRAADGAATVDLSVWRRLWDAVFGIRFAFHDTMSCRPASQSRIAYFTAQGIATLGWWAVLGLSPSARRWFAFGDTGASLLPFLPADLVLWAGGSLAAAWGDWTGSSWASPLRQVLCGGLACSVLHALTLAMLSRAGWPGVLLMVPALVCTAWFTWHASHCKL